MRTNELQETAMQAHSLAKGLSILVRHGTREGDAAADVLLDDLVRLTGELNAGLDIVSQP